MESCTECGKVRPIHIAVSHAAIERRWCEPCFDRLIARGFALTAARAALRVVAYDEGSEQWSCSA